MRIEPTGDGRPLFKKEEKPDPVCKIVFSDFYDLVRKKAGSKQRVCLKCKKPFNSVNGNRTCANCAKNIRKASKLSGEIL